MKIYTPCGTYESESFEQLMKDLERDIFEHEADVRYFYSTNQIVSELRDLYDPAERRKQLRVIQGGRR